MNAWMIEKQIGKMPMWYTGDFPPGGNASIICAFTHDPNGAIRYPTKQSAETALYYISGTFRSLSIGNKLHVTEHEWVQP